MQVKIYHKYELTYKQYIQKNKYCPIYLELLILKNYTWRLQVSSNLKHIGNTTESEIDTKTEEKHKIHTHTHLNSYTIAKISGEYKQKKEMFFLLFK